MSSSEPSRFTFEPPNGGPLVGYHWPAVRTAQDASAGPRPPLVMVHGFGEHARRHAGLAAAAAAAGHEVYGFDQAGHGESPGRRAVVSGYGPAVAAVGALLDRAAGAGTALLYGHSMGGAIALSAALAEPRRLAGLVLSAPALIDAVKRPAWLLSLSGPIARLAPSLPVANLDVTRISRDPAEVERYRSDPLIHHGGVPAVTGYTITSHGEALLSRAGSLRVPTLVVHGEADGIIDIEGSRRLAAAAPNGVVRLHTEPGAYHEMHHDPVDSGVPQRIRELVLAYLTEVGGAGSGDVSRAGPSAAGT